MTKVPSSKSVCFYYLVISRQIFIYNYLGYMFMNFSAVLFRLVNAMSCNVLLTNCEYLHGKTQYIHKFVSFLFFSYI